MGVGLSVYSVGRQPVRDCIIVWALQFTEGKIFIFPRFVKVPALTGSFAQQASTKESSAAAQKILLRDLKPISLFE